MREFVDDGLLCAAHIRQQAAGQLAQLFCAQAFHGLLFQHHWAPNCAKRPCSSHRHIYGIGAIAAFQTTVMMPSVPMRCHGSPSTRASSWELLIVSWRAPGEVGQTKWPWCSRPAANDVNAVMHQHFHAVGPAVGEQVGRVRVGSA